MKIHVLNQIINSGLHLMSTDNDEHVVKEGDVLSEKVHYHRRNPHCASFLSPWWRVVCSNDGPLSTAQLSALCIISPNKNWIGVLFVLLETKKVDNSCIWQFLVKNLQFDFCWTVYMLSCLSWAVFKIVAASLEDRS